MALFANPVLKPGMNLMQNLNMPRKIGVLSATFFIPVVLVVYELWSYSHASIDFTRIEVNGLAVIKPLNTLMDSAIKLQNPDTHIDGLKSGDQALTDLRSIAAQADIPDLNQSISTLADNWKAAQSGDNQRVTTLVESVAATYADVADRSKLTLDPDLDTFYLMYTVTDVTPRLAVELGNYELQLNRNDADKEKTTQALARINLQRNALSKAVDRANYANKKLATKISLARVNSAGLQLEAPGLASDSSIAKKSVTEMWKAVAEFSTLATNELDSLLKQRLSSAQTKIAFIALVAFVLFSPALYLLICFYVSNNSGFGAMISRMKKLAKGDLSLNFPAQGIDEISILIDSLNDSRGQLQNLIANIRKSADNIDRAGQQIGSVANKLRQQQVSQSETVKHTAQSVSEVSRKVQLNLDNAVDANRCAEDAFGVATKGNEVVAQVVTTMQTISTSSNKIGDIIGVIDDIAFQTNLLALNAAVEAARAGEQGAGFAVVAAEVRNLAQRSSTAASEIKKLITHSLENVNRGATLVTTAGNTMQEILQSVRRVSGLMSDITTASKTQAEDVGRLNQAVSKIDEDSLRSVALVKDTSAAMSTLDTEVGNLLESVSYFTFEGEVMSDGMHATTQGNAPALAAAPAATVQKRVA